MLINNFWSKKLCLQGVVISSLMLLVPIVAFGQGAQSNSPSFLSELDIYSKVFGVAVASIVSIIGLPLVILNFKKTRAEIRKIELEAAALEAKAEVGAVTEHAQQSDGYLVNIIDSQKVKVTILADPRFLAPLLLLLDFIVAYIFLHIANYVLDIVESGLSRILSFTISVFLFLPILRESLRVRKNLKSQSKASDSDSE